MYYLKRKFPPYLMVAKIEYTMMTVLWVLEYEPVTLSEN